MPSPNHTPNFNALYSVVSIRQIENAARTSNRSVALKRSLMQAAGNAASDFAQSIISDNAAHVLILAGPGDNGGDAFEVGHHLAQSGHQVFAIMCGDAAQYSADAQSCLARAKASGVQFVNKHILSTIRPEQWALIIDGLFGIGLNRAISDEIGEIGEIGELITQINQLKTIYHFPLLALDVPSGLNADTGQLVAKDSAAIVASHTITFIGDKPGLHTAAGKDYAGEIVVANLGIDAALFGTPDAYLNRQFLSSPVLHPRKQDSHKGSFGDVWIIGGANGMVGAAILSARSAIHSGAGRVFIGFLADQAPAYDGLHPELMCRHASEVNYDNAVIVIGPGMGNSNAARLALANALQHAPAIVIDADALNMIAADSELQNALKTRSQANRPSILTPHPLEAARLLACTAHDIQADRLASAQQLANQFNAVTILKGAGSIIATPQPNARTWINTTGNPALATAGTGDVLAGLCGALLAQGVASSDAACIATWAHGLAADTLVEQGTGPIGLTASELLPAIRTSLNKLAAESLGANLVF
jgi:ADP-dependent NAD(P)H-hydrate dehydratase / NAD(P)H-hydrate epimerase